MHCHLGFCEDAAQAARVLAAAGVGAFSNTVTPSEFAEQRVALAGAGNVRTGAGLHPWWVGEYDVAANWDRLYGLVARNRFIGEVGLDFSPAHIATREVQLMRWRVSLMRALERATRCCPCMPCTRSMTCSTCLNVRVRLVPWWATLHHPLVFRHVRPAHARAAGGRAATSA